MSDEHTKGPGYVGGIGHHTPPHLQEQIDQHSIERERAKMERDPWAHRSKEMRCVTCMHYVPKAPAPGSGLAPKGRCRRHAPVMAGFPVVFPNDWCGDHKLA